MPRSRRILFAAIGIAAVGLTALLIFVVIPLWKYRAAHPPIRWGSGGPPERCDMSFEEKLLATIPEGIELKTLGSIEGGGPPSAGVSATVSSSDPAIIFSPDGREVLFVGEQPENQVFIFAGGRKLGPYPAIRNPTYSPGGKHVAFIAWKGQWIDRQLQGSKYVVHDGKSGPEFTQWLVGPAFSPDGTQIAYLGCSETKTSAYVGDRRIDEYDRVGMPVYSPDGKRGGFAAEKDGKAFMVIDNSPVLLPGETFTEVGALTFSPDGSRIAYAASRGPWRWVMVVDGKAGEEFARVDPPIFSPDGAHVAYEGISENEGCVVRDGTKGMPGRNIRYLTFSPDGRHLAYLASRSEKTDGFSLLVDGKSIDEPSKTGRFVDGFGNSRGAPPVFSPDGRRIAAQASARHIGSTIVLVEGDKIDFVDEGDTGKYDYSRYGNPVFSPDGATLAYLAIREDGWHVVAGKNVSGPFGMVSAPVFSPDGKKVAFGAQKGRELWWKVIDVK